MQLDFLTRELPPVTRAASTAAKKSPPATIPAEDPTHEEPHHYEKAPRAFKTISEAADALGVPQHVLRFWESKFSQIRPMKLRGGRRYYRPEDMDILSTIQHLLYKQGYTIKGAKKAFTLHDKVAITLKESPKQVAASQAPAAERRFSDKKHSQLAAIREELLALRDALAPYVEA